MNQCLIYIFFILPWIAASPCSSLLVFMWSSLPSPASGLQMPSTRHTAGWAGVISLLLKEAAVGSTVELLKSTTTASIGTEPGTFWLPLQCTNTDILHCYLLEDNQ